MKKLAVVLAMGVLLTGCATSRSIIDVPPGTPQNAQTAAANGKAVYINAVRDNRSFQKQPKSPDIPSLDPSEASTDTIKLRAIGRKRNGYGKALGDILLKDGTTVESLIASATRRAFSENGWQVLDYSTWVTPGVYVVDVGIDQFWTWMNPGFWAITLSTEITTSLNIKEGAKKQHAVVQVKASDLFQVGTDSNYIKIITDALTLYVEDLKPKLKSLEQMGL